MAECRICGSETAILTAQEEHITLNEASGHLQAKYPFKMDSAVLINNGKDAKACQVSQEQCQIRNKTHTQYVEQFVDMLS